MTNAINHGLALNAGAVRPNRKWQSFSAKCKGHDTSPISLLRLAICPVAIFWAVIAIIVPTLQGQSIGRPRPYIGKKVLEGIAPALANRDASSTVARVNARTRIRASANHLQPRGMFWPSRITMLVKSGNVDLLLQAATGPRIASAKRIAGDHYFVAAVTAAQPSGPRAPPRSFAFAVGDRPRISHNEEAFKTLTMQVLDAWIEDHCFGVWRNGEFVRIAQDLTPV